MVSTKEFEDHFHSLLKAASFPSASVSRKTISLRLNQQKVGEIYIQHLRNAGGYYAGIEVFGGEVHEFCTHTELPYKSQLLNASTLSASSLSEPHKLFGDLPGGVIAMPRSDDIHSTCEKILSRLQAIYYPKAIHCIEARPELIADVISNPTDYSYPLLAILYAAKKNGIGLSDKLISTALQSKAIVKNKHFDLTFAADYLKP